MNALKDLNPYLNTPLIWTSKGNLPLDRLTCIPHWHISASGVELAIEYYDGNELVKRDVHLYDKQGVTHG